MMTLQKPPRPASLAHLAELTRRRGIRQFVKFAIVGASSTVITFAVLNLTLDLLHGHRYISATVAFLVSVGNGYFWNKRWTFREAQAKAVHTQFSQFFMVNVVGLVLTWLIMRLVATPMDHQLLHLRPFMPQARVYKISTNIGQIVAVPIVVFWNFFANRKWTFQHH
jgi:putative flippase GtrA